MNHRNHVVHTRQLKWLAGLSVLLLGLPGLAAADTSSRCTNETLSGRYVFKATGYTRSPASAPGSAWAPKAILEVIQFNGDGTLTTPSVTAANPFGDTGAILQPGAGAPGSYSINEDCTGSVHFADASSVAFKIYVSSHGETLWMIQINPANNVFEGVARRVR
jgi:hypothetical protein